MTYEYLTTEFLPKVIENISDSENSVANQTIDNFQFLFGFCARYASGNVDDDSVSDDEYPNRVEFMRVQLNSIKDKLAEKFNLDIRIDTYEDLQKIYTLFIINRISTIGNIIDYLWDDNDTIPESMPLEDVLEVIFNAFGTDLSLSTIMDMYYMERLTYFHDKIYFETPKQTFYESFFFGETVSMETLRDYPDMIDEFKSIVTKRRIKTSIKK